MAPPFKKTEVSSSNAKPSTLVTMRAWRLYITERSIRRILSLWVILCILYEKSVKETGYEAVLCLLWYLNNELVNKVKLVSLCVFLANKNHVVEDSEEVREEEANREVQDVRQVQHHGTITSQENQEVREDGHEENLEVNEENLEVQEDLQVQHHGTITFQENQEIEELREDGHEENLEVNEENLEAHEDGHEAPILGAITEDQEVKEEKTEEEKDLQRLKRRSDWWVNTRNVMAMVAIFLATLSITGSFTPPANVLDVKVAAIIFSVALHICFMVSMSVLFFLFGVTSTSPSIEQRILKVANVGLWISFFSLNAAYLVNIWVSMRYIELKICLSISTSVGFGVLASLLFSSKLRAAFGGAKILKETDDDVNPYILYEIFKVQEAHVVNVEV